MSAIRKSVDQPPPLAAPAAPGPMADAPRRPGRSAAAADLAAVAAVAALFATAALLAAEVPGLRAVLYVRFPPLIASWLPHTGPGTVPACILAVLAVAYGPAAARRLPERALPWAAWAAAMAWIWALALVDGWYRGVTHRLDTPTEYLRAVPRVHDIGATLRGFTDHILLGSPDHWPVHVAGHPPGALLVFTALDRIGLPGGAWAAALCVTVGASAAPAILLTLRTLESVHRPPAAGLRPGAEGTAQGAVTSDTDPLSLTRRAAPFVVIGPAAVWIGVSADGLFAGVAAWAAALLALAGARAIRWPAAAALGGGLLLGFAAYLSYGLPLFTLVAVAALAAGARSPRRALRPALAALLGATAVAAAFTLAGFNWLDGYHLLVTRYYQGVARVRPYAYWVWANLACVALCAGPAAVAGLRRGAARWIRRPPPWQLLPVAAAVAAIAVADLSGMSKAETERIWLPFAVWLPAAAALLPRRARPPWLAAQAATALLVNHLFLTSW